MTTPCNSGKTIKRVNNRENLARLLAAMLEGTRTSRQLAEDSGMAYGTVIEFTTTLHQHGVIHIASWAPSASGKGSSAAQWQLGPGTDAPKRKALTTAQRTAAYQRRRRATLKAIAEAAARQAVRTEWRHGHEWPGKA